MKPRAHKIDGVWYCYIEIKKRNGTLSIVGDGDDLEEAYASFMRAYAKHTI